MAPARAHVARSLGTPGIAAWTVPQSIAAARMMYFMGSFCYVLESRLDTAT